MEQIFLEAGISRNFEAETEDYLKKVKVQYLAWDWMTLQFPKSVEKGISLMINFLF